MMKKYKVKEDCFCQSYLHEITRYFREGLTEKRLKKDDEVELVKEWNNLYCTYLRVKKNGIEYDMLYENLQEIITDNN